MAEKNKRVMRYIVPFSFSDVTYEQLCTNLERAPGWEAEAVTERAGDIYRYIYHALECQEGLAVSAGSAWKYTVTEKGSNQICGLALRKDDGEFVYGGLAEAGLYIFRTGIGLFWYEISLERPDLTVQEMISCQSRLKELNRRPSDGRVYRMKKNRIVQVDTQNLLLEKPEGKGEQWVTVCGDKDKPGCQYYVKQSYLSEIPEYHGEGIAYRLIEKTEGKEKVSLKYHSVQQMSLGVWVTEMINVLDCGIQYYPGCKNNQKVRGNYHGQPDIVPEEALLFSYFPFQEGDGIDSREALLDAAWHLNNGYSRNFLMPEGMERQMYQPFKEAYWYAASEGCGCYVRVNRENEQFLQGNMPHRMRTDYFTLYMLLLYQAYSLLHFSEKIEYELSADAGIYLESSEDYSQKLQLIQTEINTFLLKSVHTSVSHVQYQNDVYNYIAEKLRIKEDVKSLTAGVDFLEELQETREEKQRAEKEKKETLQRLREEEKKERREREEARQRQREDDRLSIGVSILSLLTVLSAFSDGIGFLDSVKNAGGFQATLQQGPWYIAIMAVVAAAAMIAVLIFGYSVRRFWKNRKAEDTNYDQKTKEDRQDE